MYSGRNTSSPVKKLVELVAGPTMCPSTGKGRAQEADGRTLHYHTSDSLLDFHLRISPARKVSVHYTHID
jgi:hypothetical protein